MKLIVVELKLFLREPLAAFFTLVFPLVLLIVNSTTNDSTPEPRLGGQRPIDVAGPMLAAIIVALLGLTTLPPFLASYRERGILRRMAATPVSPSRVLAAQLVVHLIVAFFSLAAVLVVGMAFFDMSGPRGPMVFAVTLLVGSVAVFALGFVLAAVAPTVRAASAIGLGIFFPMLYASGTMIPRELLPESLRRVGDWTPLAPVVQSLRSTWTSGDFDVARVLVLLGIAVVAGGVAARLLRW